MTREDKLGCGMAVVFWTCVLIAIIVWENTHPVTEAAPPVYPEQDASDWGPWIPGAM